MADFASLVVKMDSSDLKKGQAALGDVTKAAGGAEKATDGASRAFAGMGRGLAVAAASALAAAVSIAAIVGTLNRFIDATVETEKVQAQLAAAIASTGGAAGKSIADLNAQAVALQKVTTFGDESINAMQGLLLTFTQIKGDQFDAATKATLDLATAMGTDLSSAALQVGKALNDPVLGMTALSRSGIQFTDAQKAMVKSMVAANDTIGAQTVILAELERQFGGSAEAARNTLGGALASLRNAFGDLFEMSGPGSKALRDAIEGLTKAVSDPAFIAGVQSIGTRLFAAAEIAIQGLALIPDALRILGAAIVVLAATQIPALIGSMVTASAGMSFMTAQFIAGAMAARAMTVAAGIARGAMLLLGGPIGIAVGLVTALAAALYLMPAAVTPTTEAIKLLDEAQRAANGAADDFAKRKAPATVQALVDTRREALAAAKSLLTLAEADVEALRASSQGKAGYGARIALVGSNDRIDAIKEEVAAQQILLTLTNNISAAQAEVAAAREATAAATEREVAASVIANGLFTDRVTTAIANAETAQGMLATMLAQNEIARIEAQYGADSVHAAEARQRAELAVLDAQLKSLKVSETLKLEIMAAAQAGFDLANVAGSINFSSAIGGAEALAQRLGVSLAIAMQIAAVAGSSNVGSEVFDPRSPRYNKAAQDEVNRVNKLAELRKSFEDANAAAAAAALSADKFSKSTGGAAGAAKDAAAGLANAAKEAENLRKEMEAPLVSAIDGVSNAFGDFIMGGLKDFGGFVKSILASFKQMLSQMIAMAVKNKIMISLGIGGGATGVAGAAAAATGGGGGGILSGVLGGILGTGGAGLAGLAGSGGIMGGLGSLASGLGGILSGGGLGASFANLGGLISGSVSGLGAIGAALPAVGLIVAAFSFLKKKSKELDAGLKVTVGGLDTLVQTFSVIETKRFWGLSKKVSTSFKNASDEIANPLIKAVGEIQGGIVDAAALLGIAGSTFDDFAHTINVSTNGLSDEAAQKAVIEAFTGLGDAFAGMIPGLQALQKDGEGAMAAITRLASSLTVVNDVFQSLGFSAYDVSLAGAAAADTFASLFGSLDNFAAATAAYYDAFYSGEEKRADATSRLAASLAVLGVSAIPQDRAAFRDLVDSAQLAGNDALAAGLIMLAPAFAGLTDAVEVLAAAIITVNEDRFATGVDFMRGTSRASNGIEYTPRESDAELRAELRALNLSMERLVSSAEITAGNTGRGADAADDQLAFTLEQTL